MSNDTPAGDVSARDRLLLGALLQGASRVPVPAARRDPSRWPGCQPRTAVRVLRLPVGLVAALWDFEACGGSFGEDDATALVAAAGLARSTRTPLLTVIRSGGTRLQEGMAALVGIPRARLALLALAADGVPHLSVADAPTTGGVWISVVSGADLRVAVAGAIVGFAGPRVVEAVTGVPVAPGSHTAESAFAAGLVDQVLEPSEVEGWVRGVLAALVDQPGPFEAGTAAQTGEPVTGWDQVQRARARTESGSQLLARLLTDRVPLAGADDTVAACLGRWAGRRVVGVALAAELGGRPTPAGYRLAARATRLADRLGLPLVSLVDTPGAEPGTEAERDGIAPTISEALDALLTCRSPTLTVLSGEGGSGGAVALAAADALLVTPNSYFAALGPEGASAALRRPRDECADLMRLTPIDLVTLGVADALVADPADGLAWLVRLGEQDPQQRRQARTARWSAPLPGQISRL